MSLTVIEIKSAIEAIVAEGQNPTQVKVRDQLGRGSYTTINEVLRQWRKENNQTIDFKSMDSLEILNLYQNGEINFSGIDLSEANLTSSNLSCIDLSKSILKFSLLKNVI
ncbi:MAG: DNA-binding protein [Xenococcaceae cyanobacterium]